MFVAIMEVRAVAKSIKISPRKVRLVADSIRNLSIDEAISLLSSTQKRAALPLAKTLNSAVANATNNSNLERKNLLIGSITVNEGQALKRYHPSTRGRIHPYKKRSSIITIILKEKTVSVTSKAQDAEVKKSSSEKEAKK